MPQKRIIESQNRVTACSQEVAQIIEETEVPAVQGLSRSMLIASADDGQCIGQVLKMMVGNKPEDTQLQQIVDKTILFADRDEDGKISFEEFCSVVGNTDIHKKMVVDV
ncbi:hypothetical protein MSG28_004869 [Choristoneura fumiferana]|uniref:Uncharacterized protein n=1 Tax=Choristoneura fumiferana TaxID=7141 RepID=A0ACC0K8F4_CHOFU|nr:hypothetical protein MSG28_004869 [Choristoneura fumiferana]